MANKRKRGRATGRFESGEHFAAIPTDVMHSAPYGALPDYAVRVLLALAAKFRGANNGNLSLTGPDAAALGVKAQWKVRAGLELLLSVRLIERTREGKYQHGRGECALYALSWKPINVTPQAFPPIDNERPAPNGWATWERHLNWREYEAAIRRTAKGAKEIDPELKAVFDRTTREVHDGTTRVVQEILETPVNGTTRRVRKQAVHGTTRSGHLLDSGRGGGS